MGEVKLVYIVHLITSDNTKPLGVNLSFNGAQSRGAAEMKKRKGPWSRWKKTGANVWSSECDDWESELLITEVELDQ